MTNREKQLALFRVTCEKIHGHQLIGWQLRYAEEALDRVLAQRRHSITVSACRQVGKTETTAMLVWMLSQIFHRLTGERFLVSVASPNEDTSSEVFYKIRELFRRGAQMGAPALEVDTKNEIATADARITTFGLFRSFAERHGQKSTKEGRTRHLIVRDEMHLGDDAIFNDELVPSLSTTGGVDIFLGNGGYRNCSAKRRVERGDDQRHSLFLYRFPDAEADTELQRLLPRWLDSQQAYVEEHGAGSDEVRKNLYCDWIVERGNFVLPGVLHACARKGEPTAPSPRVDIGLDLAKSSDRSVVTLTDFHRNVREWLVLPHTEYESQFDELAIFLEDAAKRYQLGKLYFDATGAGDPAGEILRRKLRGMVACEGVVFSPQSKDAMGKNMERVLHARAENERLSYPADHPHAKDFEREMISLEKEYRSHRGYLFYHHPDVPGARDDFVDSLALSLHGMCAKGDFAFAFA